MKLIQSSDLSLDNSEAFSCTFHPPKSQPLTIITIYRPPNNSIPYFIDEIDNLLSMISTNSILLGDFNIPILPNSHNSNTFINIINCHNFLQHVKSSTHSSGNILDLIISNTSSNIISNTNVHSLITDHHLVSCSLHIPKPIRPLKKVPYRKLDNINIANFINDFNILYNNITDSSHIDSFDSNLSLVLDKHAPIITKTYTARHNTLWFNNSLHTAKRSLRIKERNWRKSKSENDLNIFKHSLSNYRKLIKTAKNKYYIDQIKSAGKDTKKLFRISSTLLGKLTKRILPDNSPSTNATNFDSYFYIKTSSIIDTLPRPCIPPISSPVYSFSTFSLPTIININNLLLTVKSTCKLDPIPLCLLHSLSSLLSPFYKKIIDRSLTAGIFPSHIKYAHVIPIPKNQSIDRLTLSNYRPISNLSFISKTIERIIAKQLRTYINNNNILHKLQSAYTTDKSTETSLLHTLNNILLFPKNTPTILILLDLSSAFDTLDHNILIRRLENIGIKDSVLSWFTSYLINRSFSICIDNAITEPRHTTHGVPQGSVLGPILFNIYIFPLYFTYLTNTPIYTFTHMRMTYSYTVLYLTQSIT